MVLEGNRPPPSGMVRCPSASIGAPGSQALDDGLDVPAGLPNVALVGGSGQVSGEVAKIYVEACRRTPVV